MNGPQFEMEVLNLTKKSWFMMAQLESMEHMPPTNFYMPQVFLHCGTNNDVATLIITSLVSKLVRKIKASEWVHFSPNVRLIAPLWTQFFNQIEH